jgi:hypothetical protein
MTKQFEEGHIREMRPRIYKLHGTFSKAFQDVSWNDLKELHRAKTKHLKHYWSNHNFIFVGYSVRDMDIRHALESIEIDRRKNLTTYWFTKTRTGEKIAGVMRKYSNIENVIRLGNVDSGSTVFMMLEQALSAMEEKDARFSVLAEVRSRIEKIQNELDDIKSTIDQLSRA